MAVDFNSCQVSKLIEGHSLSLTVSPRVIDNRLLYDRKGRASVATPEQSQARESRG
jgi:hypothetical protein